MSEEALRTPGLIGPNAILQLLPVLDLSLGPEQRAQILGAAGIVDLPDGRSMIPEDDAARLHRQLRSEVPDVAPAIASAAGIATANYIMAHRIPRPAQWLLKALPRDRAAIMLSSAVEKHAWTFVGSGRFTVLDAWTFEIERNPLICGETSEGCLCHWHAAVFERLYQSLVTPSCRCVETRCGAQSASETCRFNLTCKA